MSLLVALYTVAAFAVTKGIWVIGAMYLNTQFGIIDRIKAMFNDDTEALEDEYNPFL